MIYFSKTRWLFLAAAGAGAVCGQSSDHLTAREIFYAAAKPAETKPAATKPSKPVRRPARKTSEPATPTAAETSASAASNARPASAPNPPPQQENHQITPAQLASFTHKPLGIRLSISKAAQGGEAVEVAPDTDFHSGDRVRLNIEVSDHGYLYIINRGSSGTWTQLFPSPDLPNATNAVAPGARYSIPADRYFVVNNPPGVEKMFLILSRQPQLDIQALTDEMSRRGSGAAPKTEPAPPPAHAPQTVIAQNLPPLNDSTVDRLRQFYARDLIIEKVDPNTPGETKENAVYAVSTGDGDDTRVVLDAQISHK